MIVINNYSFFRGTVLPIWGDTAARMGGHCCPQSAVRGEVPSKLSAEDCPSMRRGESPSFEGVASVRSAEKCPVSGSFPFVFYKSIFHLYFTSQFEGTFPRANLNKLSGIGLIIKDINIAKTPTS